MKNKFIPIRSDIIFRIFFADERNLEELTAFLKSVVRLPDEDYEVIEISDPHLLPDFKDGKFAVIDVKIKTKTDKTIHIEIQLQVTAQLRSRIVFYSAKLLSEQMGSGDKYDKVRKVISILITEEKLVPNSDKYHHCFTMRDSDNGVELTDLIEIHTLELIKIPPASDGTQLYDWVSFIAADSEEELAMIAERNPQVGKAVMKYKVLSADERTRDLYERQEKARRDALMFMDDAIMKKQLEIARRLLMRNRPIEEIIEDTGLALEDIETLRNENQI